MTAELLGGLVIGGSRMQKKISRCTETCPPIGSASLGIVNPARAASSGKIHPIISTIKASWREFTFASPPHVDVALLSASEWIISLLFTVGQFEHAMIDGRISMLHQHLFAAFETKK